MKHYQDMNSGKIITAQSKPNKHCESLKFVIYTKPKLPDMSEYEGSNASLSSGGFIKLGNSLNASNGKFDNSKCWPLNNLKRGE